MVTKGNNKRREKRPPKPLDQRKLNDLALSYVARFATSAAKLEAYLWRKIRERGQADEGEPLDVAAIVARMVELRYIDDEAYARSKAGGLLRRGYGGRRVDQALRAAGIDDAVRTAVAPEKKEARLAAFSLAEKRRFGPFGPGTDNRVVDRAGKEKQIAAMIRAGHDFDSARALVYASTIEQAEEWLSQADDF
jgi:regulatory protein